MRFPLTFFTLALGLAAPGLAAPAGGLSFVQATVVAPNAAAGTLSFVDVSGRSRSHAISDAAAARVGRLRPGDEVIVVLSGSEPVVQDVRVSHAALAPAAAEPVAAADAPAPAEATWTVVPVQQMRPSWPNPYSRFYKGPKPATKPRRP
jgi:hypothetical protein